MDYYEQKVIGFTRGGWREQNHHLAKSLNLVLIVSAVGLS